MRKLRNTLYVTKEESFLSLDGENVVLCLEGKEIGRLPFNNLENIICMNYLGCSPALMGKCATESVGLCFVSPSGKFLARVTGPVKGNVLLRKAQLEVMAQKNPDSADTRANHSETKKYKVFMIEGNFNCVTPHVGCVD